MYDWNEAVRSLNVGLPDDIARLKAAGYYQEAIARIDRLLAEDLSLIHLWGRRTPSLSDR